MPPGKFQNESVVNGVLTACRSALEKQVRIGSPIIQCEFQFNGGRTFLLGCDATSKHVGRLVTTAMSAKLVEDASEIEGKQPGQTEAGGRRRDVHKPNSHAGETVCAALSETAS